MMSISEDTKFQILHDHYKESFAYLRNYLKIRDRLFFLILVVVTLILFQIHSPKDSGEAINQYIVSQFGLSTPIDISFLGSVIWFGLLGLVVRYYQTAVLTERQYCYIHQIEEQMSANYDNKAFTREGKFYLSDYPLFLNWADKFYKIIFPTLLLFVAFLKIISEWFYRTDVNGTLIFNTLVALSILISTSLYLLQLHFRK